MRVLLNSSATLCSALQQPATQRRRSCITAYCNTRAPHCATHCTALHRTATHCNALQRTATHCTALQRTATHCTALHRTAPHCNALQRTATHCNTLQHTATHCIIPTATHCNALQRTGSCPLQHTASHCNTLQHTATHCQCLKKSSDTTMQPFFNSMAPVFSKYGVSFGHLQRGHLQNEGSPLKMASRGLLCKWPEGGHQDLGSGGREFTTAPAIGHLKERFKHTSTNSLLQAPNCGSRECLTSGEAFTIRECLTYEGNASPRGGRAVAPRTISVLIFSKSGPLTTRIGNLVTCSPL